MGCFKRYHITSKYVTILNVIFICFRYTAFVFYLSLLVINILQTSLIIFNLFLLSFLFNLSTILFFLFFVICFLLFFISCIFLYIFCEWFCFLLFLSLFFLIMVMIWTAFHMASKFNSDISKWDVSGCSAFYYGNTFKFQFPSFFILLFSFFCLCYSFWL